jgi:predicted acetyltransferase
MLVKPDESLLEEIQAYRGEMLAAGSSMDGTGPLRRMEDEREWLDFNRAAEDPETLPEGLVAAEQFAYLREEDQKIVGMIQFRHELNDYLRAYGGHIGYSVRPSERRKGYAKRMLADCLDICRAFGLTRVLVTCHEDNEGSRRTILANGGVYENTVYSERDDATHQRYWISL